MVMGQHDFWVARQIVKDEALAVALEARAIAAAQDALNQRRAALARLRAELDEGRRRIEAMPIGWLG
jgi:hypothetical protein